MAQYTFETKFELDNLISLDLLPNDYRMLKYISQNNTFYCIGTNISSNGIFKFKLKYNDISYNTSFGFGPTWWIGTKANSVWRLNGSDSTINVDTKSHTVIWDDVIGETMKLYVDGILIKENGVVDKQYETFYMFGMNASYHYRSSNPNMNIYSFEYFDSNNILIHNFFPAIDSNDNIGLFDTITNDFIVNTTNQWISGGLMPNVSLSVGDEGIVNEDKKHYIFNGTDWEFWYKEQDPLIFRGFTFEETVSKLTFSPLVFRGFTFEESPKIRNVSPLVFRGFTFEESPKIRNVSPLFTAGI